MADVDEGIERIRTTKVILQLGLAAVASRRIERPSFLTVDERKDSGEGAH